MTKAVVFLLDRSGSMQSILDSTIESFNGYLNELKQQADVLFTLVTFDTISTDVVHRRMPIADVPDLNKTTLVPRGSTPLIDAACSTLRSTIESYQQADAVVFTILTDGFENASRENKMSDLHDLIKQVTGWGWQVVFLGASIDAYADAGRMGVGVGSTMSYNAADPGASLRAYGTVAAKTAEFFQTGEAVSFSAEDKAAAGDKFAQRAKAQDLMRETAMKLAEPIVSRETSTTLVDKPEL